MSDHEPQEASSSSMETFVAKNDNYHQLQSPSQLQELLSKDLNRISLLYFRAEWAEVCKTTDPLIKSLAQKLSEPLFLEIEAESLPEVTESFEVESVPSFIILRGHELYSRILGTQVSQVESDLIKYLNKTSKNQQVGNGLNQGGRYQTLSETHEKPKSPGPRLSGGTKSVNNNDGSEETEEEVFERCKKLMNQSKVVVFMKGDPKTPRCGFSQQTVKILQDLKIEFTTFDILSDESVRRGMKKLNSWPTFPQIIVKGELIGGLDILKEMIQKNGKEKSELEELLA